MDRSVLSHATSSDDSPTPGYLYGEIAAMTKASYADCQKVQTFLLDRIKKKNHNVKYKCLLIIKHVCMKGRGDFKREMQRNMEDVKECLSFSGPPDPLRGDEIYRRVREAARETLEVIYADPIAVGALGGPGSSGGVYSLGGAAYASGNRIEGFGSQPVDMIEPAQRASLGSIASAAVDSIKSITSSATGNAGGGGGGSGYASYGGGEGRSYGSGSFRQGGAGGMQGLGNYDPTQDKTWLERTSEAVKDVAGKVDLSRLRLGRDKGSGMLSNSGEPTSGYSDFSPAGYPNNRSSGMGAGLNASYGGYRPADVTTAYEEARRTAAQPFQWSQGGSSTPGSGGGGGGTAISGAPGGLWGSVSSGAGSSSVGQPVAPGTSSSAAGAGASAPAPFVGRTGGGTSDGSYERQQVEDLCTPGGTRSAPPQEELDSFLRNASGLDAERLGSALLDCCVRDGADWRAQSKALAVILALLRMSTIPAGFRDFLADAADDLSPLCVSPKVAVRDKATRLLRNLGRAAPAPDGFVDQQKQQKQQQQQQGGHGALGGDEVPASPGSANGGEADLLGYEDADDEEEERPAAAVPVPASIDLLGGGEDAQPANGTGNSSSSLFGGLAVKGKEDNGVAKGAASTGAAPRSASDAPSSAFSFIAVSAGDENDGSQEDAAAADSGPTSDLLGGFSPTVSPSKGASSVKKPAELDLLGDPADASSALLPPAAAAVANRWEGLDPLGPKFDGPPPPQQLRPQPAKPLASPGAPDIVSSPAGSMGAHLGGMAGMPFQQQQQQSGLMRHNSSHSQDGGTLQRQGSGSPFMGMAVASPPLPQQQQLYPAMMQGQQQQQQHMLQQQQLLQQRQQQIFLMQQQQRAMQMQAGGAPSSGGYALMGNGVMVGSGGALGGHAMLPAGAARAVIPDPHAHGGAAGGSHANSGAAQGVTAAAALKQEADSFGFVHEALKRESLPR